MIHTTHAQLFVRVEADRLAYRLNVLQPRFGAGSYSFTLGGGDTVGTRRGTDEALRAAMKQRDRLAQRIGRSA